MAKAIGLIGNFKGKVGNMVGYQIPDSNTGNTQGIRIYQPVVKNPKTSAQAEQRAKLAPINATYRALKSIIDRGNEGLPYGNKSRLAWLKQAFKAEKMPWFEKGANITHPVGCQLTKGSLGALQFTFEEEDAFNLKVQGVTSSTPVSTIGGVSTALLAGYPSLKAGDQVTIVLVGKEGGVLATDIFSFVLNTTDATAIDRFEAGANQLMVSSSMGYIAAAAVVSREGVNGEHLRSTTSLTLAGTIQGGAPYDSISKTEAIESYMASAAGSTDWAEESIQ